MKTLMIAGALLAMSAGAALAADAGQVRVSAAGLDLGHSAGAQKMLKRLDVAAMSACGASKFSFADVRRATRAGDCYKTAMDGAVSALGAPVVTSLYQSEARTLAAD